jgi:hypothetical protein
MVFYWENPWKGSENNFTMFSNLTVVDKKARTCYISQK